MIFFLCAQGDCATLHLAVVLALLTQKASLILLGVQGGKNGGIHLANHSGLIKGRLALSPQTQLALGHHVVQSFAYLIGFVLTQCSLGHHVASSPPHKNC